MKTVLLLIALVLGGCADAPRLETLHGKTMGTTWSVKYRRPPAVDADRLALDLQRELDTVVAQMSTWQVDSDLTRFNRAPAQTWQTLPAGFYAVLEHALRLARETGGAYDPTVGPLVDLWGFGPVRREREPPSDAAIAAARARVGWQRIRLDPAGRRAWQPGGVQLDLSSIAKGFGVDQVARRLDAAGVSSYLVEVGGELRGRGRRPDGAPWQVAIERPGAAPGAVQRLDEVERVLSLEDRALATSGDYRHAFEDHGTVYSHHIDPRSGRPVAHRLASVTVAAREAIDADPLGTTMMVLGPEAGMAYAVEHRLAVLLIVRTDEGFEERVSPAFAALLGSAARPGDAP
ncbi:MAG TPA: FAD:protein FMN transferase [Dokdonella sp.]|uniref:FAD:protein FMN transferase n=1 Tax=Dokdonella sp. TaxID=2291710 RepID=UPI002BF68131|nr:FAD:protein FMN transferase [Dokdonella sp.]HUD40462.1 FAD:protein FMN transferase [Dokdonella sp.]